MVADHLDRQANSAPGPGGRRSAVTLRLIAVAMIGLGVGLDGLLTKEARAAAAPTTVGACSQTTVTAKRFRMASSPGDPGYQPSSSPLGKEVLISFANGLGLYAGEGDAFILSNHFAPGHRVTLCLVSLPKDCPPGDDRGKVYRLTDLQTRRTLTGIDSWHLCGGA